MVTKNFFKIQKVVFQKNVSAKIQNKSQAFYCRINMIYPFFEGL